MYEKVLLPIANDDDKAATDRMLDIAQALTVPTGEVMLMHVVEALPSLARVNIPQGVLDKARDEAKAMLEGVADRISRTTHVELVTGHGGRSIVDYATSHGADCIVMRSHRPEIQDVIFGSTAAHVVRHAPCSVHVIR